MALGNPRRRRIDAARQARSTRSTNVSARAGLDAALAEGAAILAKKYESALDAVEAAVRVLEEDMEALTPGRGSGFDGDRLD